MFHPHEDAEARITRTKIENTKDDCLVEERTPAEVNYAGFGFATLHGYDAMLEALDPSAIICLGKPFDEMRGNVVPVKYEIFRREAR